MTLEALLAPERTRITHDALDRDAVLDSLAALLANGVDTPAADIAKVLHEREELQSTGLGEGVAIPHGALASVGAQRAALLVVPSGVDFDAIDGERVRLFIAVVGPRSTSGEHLRILARLSRVLRSRLLRERLVHAKDAGEAYALLVQEDAA